MDPDSKVLISYTKDRWNKSLANVLNPVERPGRWQRKLLAVEG